MKKRLLEILERMRRTTVIVVGEMILDVYLFALQERLSQEAPLPILRIQSVLNRPGGAGNLAANLHALNVTAIPLAVTGTDYTGDRLIETLARERVTAEFILRIREFPTPLKMRGLACAPGTVFQHIARFDLVEKPELAPAHEDTLINSFSGLISSADAVVCSDNGLGAITPRLRTAILTISRDQGKPVFVDSRQAPDKYPGASAVKVNQKELERKLGKNWNDAGVFKALKEWRTKQIMVTLGAAGTLLYTSGTKIHVPAYQIEPRAVNPGGAGDSFVAVLTAATLAGASAAEAACLGSIAAGLSTTTHYTNAVSHQQIQNAIQEL